VQVLLLLKVSSLCVSNFTQVFSLRLSYLFPSCVACAKPECCGFAMLQPIGQAPRRALSTRHTSLTCSREARLECQECITRKHCRRVVGDLMKGAGGRASSVVELDQYLRRPRSIGGRVQVGAAFEADMPWGPAQTVALVGACWGAPRVVAAPGFGAGWLWAWWLQGRPPRWLGTLMLLGPASTALQLCNFRASAGVCCAGSANETVCIDRVGEG